MDPHLILYVFLPILIFEAAFALDMHTFKKSFENAFWMAGIVTATVMTGILLHFCIPIEALGLGAWANFDLESILGKVRKYHIRTLSRCLGSSVCFSEASSVRLTP